MATTPTPSSEIESTTTLPLDSPATETNIKTVIDTNQIDLFTEWVNTGAIKIYYNDKVKTLDDQTIMTYLCQHAKIDLIKIAITQKAPEPSKPDPDGGYAMQFWNSDLDRARLRFKPMFTNRKLTDDTRLTIIELLVPITYWSYEDTFRHDMTDFASPTMKEDPRYKKIKADIMKGMQEWLPGWAIHNL